MIIEVTQEDIDKGIPRNPSRCMLSRAIGRYFPNKDVTSAYNSLEGQDPYAFCWVSGVNKNLSIRIKELEVAGKMKDFDENRRPVEPFSFELMLDNG